MTSRLELCYLQSFWPQELLELEPLLVIHEFHKNAFQGTEKHLKTLIKPSAMGNGTFMHMDWIFSFFLHFWALLARKQIPSEDSNWVLWHGTFLFFFFFFNESGWLSRARLFGDLSIYINGIRLSIYSTWNTSLSTLAIRRAYFVGFSPSHSSIPK